MKKKVDITVIGQGNVATHLTRAFSQCEDCEVVQVSSRTLLDLPTNADIYIISVSDSAVEAVAEHLKELLSVGRYAEEAPMVVHTAGSVPITTLTPLFTRCGVFYPLQTISKDAEVDYPAIPFLLEASNLTDYPLLDTLTAALGATGYHVDSATRLSIHAASVMACNLPNYLWTLSKDLMEKANLPFSLLTPLIEATVAKLRQMDPYDAQTGPARRADLSTIARHIEILSDHPDIKDVYTHLTDNILKLYHPNQFDITTLQSPTAYE